MKQSFLYHVLWISMALPLGLAHGQTPTATNSLNLHNTVITAPATTAVTNLPGTVDQSAVVLDTGAGMPVGECSCCGTDFGPLWASYCADKNRCHRSMTPCRTGSACRLSRTSCCAMPPARFSNQRCLTRGLRCGPNRTQTASCGGCDGDVMPMEVAPNHIDIGVPPAPQPAQPMPIEPASPNDAKAKSRIQPNPQKPTNASA